jgi:hypothetical protein
VGTVRDARGAATEDRSRRALASFDELVTSRRGLVGSSRRRRAASLGNGSLAPLRGFGLDVLVVTLVAVPAASAPRLHTARAVLLMKG